MTSASFWNAHRLAEAERRRRGETDAWSLGRIRIALAIIAVIFAAICLLLSALMPATAQEQDRAAWFKSLKQPDTGASCCDISDCRRTEARWLDRHPETGAQVGPWQWWAKVEGLWTPIPPNKVLERKISIDGDAYVCSGVARIIFCFVEPTTGS